MADCVIITDKFLKELLDKKIVVYFFVKGCKVVDNKNRFFWRSENPNIKGELSENTFRYRYRDISLGVMTDISDINGYYEARVEELNAEKKEHIRHLLLLLLHKAKCGSSIANYAERELLWFLNNYRFNGRILKDVIDSFNDIEIVDWIYKKIRKIAICLPYRKQIYIRDYLFGGDSTFKLYMPTELAESLMIFEPAYDIMNDWRWPIQQLVNKVITYQSDSIDLNDKCNLEIEKSGNIFLKVRKWLLDDEYVFEEYEKLGKILRLFSPKIQSKLLRRYFFSVYKKQTLFDKNFIVQFAKNPYEIWGIYYHCLFEPCAPIRLGVRLLSDSIDTYFTKDKRCFQTFNGLLDIAYSGCDLFNPNIDIEMNDIIPVCNGGVIPNKRFKGFINYSTLYSFKNEVENNEHNIIEIIKNVIIEKDNDSETKTFSEYKISGLSKCQLNLLKLLLEEEVVEENDIIKCIEHKFVAPSIVKNRVEQLFNNNLRHEDEVYGFYKDFSNASEEAKALFNGFLSPKWVIVRPNNDIKLDKLHDSNDLKYKVVDYIKNLLNREPDKENVFILDYWGDDYIKLKQDKFLVQQDNQDEMWQDVRNNEEFYFTSNSYFRDNWSCSPEFGGRNPVLDRSFFYCSGNQCYGNVLNEQAFVKGLPWEKYGLIAILEIMGESQIKQTPAGVEPRETIRQFVGLAKKVIRFYGSLKCRECGHILFPEKRNTDNIYNHFSCKNLLCPEFGNVYYINYCHTCKSGIVDGRDTKKCSNGWLICLKCHACCDDETIDNQIIRYRRSGRNVPVWLLNQKGKGHGEEKRELFCYKCGEMMDYCVEEDTNNKDRKCYYVCRRCGLIRYDSL